MKHLKHIPIFLLCLYPFISSKNLKAIQSITDDTLYFHDEQEFHDFLEFNELKFYDIAEPAVSFNCEEGSTVPLYTFQDASDYLHEELFVGMNFSVTIDHLITTKVFNVLMPTFGDPEATICSVNLTIHHPVSGQVAIFYDIYNWIDENGQNIFNFNKKMYFLWGYSAGKVSFDRELIQEETGYDFTFPSDMTSHPIKLNFDGIEMYNQINYYEDADGDYFGNAAVSKMAYPFAPPFGYVSNNTDCNDEDALIFPGAMEICNGLDDNCNDAIDEDLTVSASITPSGSVSICKGASQTLTATSGAGYTYQWYRNGNPIAGATDLIYHTNKAGNYTVTISSGAGCSATSSATSISLLASVSASINNLDGTNDLCADASIKLKTISGADYTYQWYKNNVIIPGAVSSMYSAESIGNYRVAVTRISTGCSKASLNYEIINSCRISEEKSKQQLSVFPNPAQSKFTISLTVDEIKSRNAYFNIISLTGQTVLQEFFEVTDSDFSKEISLPENLTTGLYVIKLQIADKQWVELIELQ